MYSATGEIGSRAAEISVKAPETRFGNEEEKPAAKPTRPRQEDNLRTKFKRFMDSLKTTTAKAVSTVSVTVAVAASAIIALPGVVDLPSLPEYTATVNLDAIDDATVIWGDDGNTIRIDNLFTQGEDENCAYRLTLFDDAGEVIEEVIDTGKSVEIQVDKSVAYAKILVEEIYLKDGKIFALDSRESAGYHLAAPTVTFLDNKVLKSHGYYLIPYVIESSVADKEQYNHLEFILSTQDEVLVADRIEVNKESYVGVYMDSFTDEFTISANLSMNGAYGGYEREAFAERTYINSPELHTVDAYYKYADPWYSDPDSLVFDFKYSAPLGSHLVMVNNDTGEETVLDIDQVYHYVSVEQETYDIYYKLVSADGEILSRTESFLFDSSVTSTYDVFNYKNPLNVTITYNDDGTINLYIPTDFASSDPKVYYEVVLGGKAYKFTDPLAKIENIPNESYSLEYRVCIDDENGMKYAIYTAIPSGVISGDPVPVSVEPSESGASVSISYGYELLGDTLSLSINGEAPIVFDKADMIYDPDTYYYTYTVEYTGDITSLVLDFASMYNETYDDMVSIYGDTIKGDKYMSGRAEYIIDNTEGE